RAVQLDLGREVGLAVVHDVAAVDVRRHALAVVVIFGGRENQLHADAFGDLDRLQNALPLGEAAEEQQIVLGGFTKNKTVGIDAVEHRVHDVQPVQQPRLLVGDGDE